MDLIVKTDDTILLAKSNDEIDTMHDSFIQFLWIQFATYNKSKFFKIFVKQLYRVSWDIFTKVWSTFNSIEMDPSEPLIHNFEAQKYVNNKNWLEFICQAKFNMVVWRMHFLSFCQYWRSTVTYICFIYRKQHSLSRLFTIANDIVRKWSKSCNHNQIAPICFLAVPIISCFLVTVESIDLGLIFLILSRSNHLP